MSLLNFMYFEVRFTFQNPFLNLCVSTVEVKSLHPPFRISKMLNILPKFVGSYKMHAIIYLGLT